MPSAAGDCVLDTSGNGAPQPTTTEAGADGSEGMGGGAIAGISVALVAVMMGAAAAAYMVWKRKTRGRGPKMTKGQAAEL